MDIRTERGENAILIDAVFPGESETASTLALSNARDDITVNSEMGDASPEQGFLGVTLLNTVGFDSVECGNAETGFLTINPTPESLPDNYEYLGYDGTLVG